MATLVEIAARIVASHASSTPMTSDELVLEIGKVHDALKTLEAAQVQSSVSSLTVENAFKKDEVTCLVCGKGGFKMLARHLREVHGMTPREYRTQFGIPSNQPLSSKNYSKLRRKLIYEQLGCARGVRLATLSAKKDDADSAEVVIAACNR